MIIKHFDWTLRIFMYYSLILADVWGPLFTKKISMLTSDNACGFHSIWRDRLYCINRETFFDKGTDLKFLQKIALSLLTLTSMYLILSFLTSTIRLIFDRSKDLLEIFLVCPRHIYLYKVTQIEIPEELSHILFCSL